VSIYGVHFDTDRTDIRPESGPTLEEIVKLLQTEPQLTLYVVGHTDNVGARDYNMDLSRRRADAVVEALVGRGADRSRLEPEGLGPLAPVASNDSDAGRGLNRRVELVAR
jgi:outer membrane protein OmpA-like peptidoglycan-associated protein